MKPPKSETPNFLSWPGSFAETRESAPSPERKKTAPWSETLQQQTREAFDRLAVPPDGLMHVKHKVLGFAMVDVLEILKDGRLVCASKDGRRWEYPDVEALLTAGWAID